MANVAEMRVIVGDKTHQEHAEELRIIEALLFAAEEPLDEIAGPLRLLMTAEPWPSDGPRRAAISNFGFGGNNAHLLLEEWIPSARWGPTGPARGPREWVDMDIAVVGETVTAGGAASTAAFEAAFLQGQSTVAGDPPQSIAEPFEMDLGLLRFPPADLKDALSQQTLSRSRQPMPQAGWQRSPSGDRDA